MYFYIGQIGGPYSTRWVPVSGPGRLTRGAAGCKDQETSRSRYLHIFSADGMTKTLFIQACFTVVKVLRKKVEHEWDSRAGDTIQVETRKTKGKVPYVRACGTRSGRQCLRRRSLRQVQCYSSQWSSSVHPTENAVDNKDYWKHLSSTCQTGFEYDVAHFFYTKRGTSEVQAAPRVICTDITKL